MRAVCTLLALFAASAVAFSPQPCAYPPQWESFFGERLRIKTTDTGAETTLVVMGNMYVDYIGKKVGLHYTIQQDAPYTLTIIGNFETQAMVAFYPDKQQCIRVPLQQSMQQQGVTSSARHLSSFRWGHSPNAVLVNQWQSTINFDKPWPCRIDLFQMVTTDECVPVVEQGTNYIQGMEIAFDSSFANFNTTITNPLAFTSPEYCTNAPVVNTPSTLVESLMMRFIRY
ncbi:hypothetical protein CAPTEDRAFT_207758 [Capitella teleta]|uniref:Mammalian ependymin-related protein 1 n=1 Tax=Capitella teleta TaxID=283909 RepID=R7TWV9_CAPTE|nr:hypothetical protein CAPTEDRAFT_207758 [Capitella teleta]|eukprot:ELT98092.1 hypothetical protein CAPTEDRAFT_207758 [Capitella teleta]